MKRSFITLLFVSLFLTANFVLASGDSPEDKAPAKKESVVVKADEPKETVKTCCAEKKEKCDATKCDATKACCADKKEKCDATKACCSEKKDCPKATASTCANKENSPCTNKEAAKDVKSSGKK